MKEYEFGLRGCPDEPQEYRLSHILAGYWRGFSGNYPIEYLTVVSAPDPGIASDGSIDFKVPARFPVTGNPIRRLLRRARLAWQVLVGRASILYYD